MAQPKPTKILVIANVIPMRDRSGGWFRFYHLLRILADKHDVWLYPSDLAWQLDYYGESDTRKYQGELEAFGIRILVGEWADLLKFVCSARLDILFFEHYGTVKDVDRIRFWHPPAIVMVDTIDVAFNRLLSKATLTGNPEDLQVAEQVKAAELAAYAEADIVIAISHADRTLLLKEAPGLQVDVLPLVYAMPCLGTAKRSLRNNLLFVAHFDHDANIDGITYFCANVLPLIINELPDVRLRVVGHSPPPAVANLASSNVEILGYVPDIAAVYEKSDVAIAPMRFGGGLKGKIGEAMSYGVQIGRAHV